MKTFRTEYEIGDKIFHVTPESRQGVIKDISYLVSTQEIQYLVAIGFNEEVWCSERELSTDKTII